jgi:hypothetical protein
MKIKHTILRDVVHEYCDSYFAEFVEENQRKFDTAFLNEALDFVSGLSNPFEINKLKDRLSSEKEFSFITRVIHTLWAAGIFGVEVRPNFTSSSDFRDCLNHLNRRFGLDPYRVYYPKKNPERAIHRWYLFEYNQDKTASQLLKEFEGSKGAIARLVVHPMAYRSLNIHTKSECPIGA